MDMASDGDLAGQLTAALADRYRIDGEIGRGGMATVYLAQDLKHNRQVAIKVLRLEGASQDSSERFSREIEVTAGLNHPHILPLLESGEIDGLPFYVMPYVEGESLRARLQREKCLPVDEAIRIALEVADALAEAHSHGLVHRDIKPGNILLKSGHAIVTDFGIVRPTGRVGNTLTRPGHSIGTPDYESPEQWAGEGWLDGRSDIYSLGCVLFEMLAGEPPFTGSSPRAVAAKHTSWPVPRVSTLRQTVPPAIDDVLQRAMAKVPADRFETASDFATALKSAHEGAEDSASPMWRRWRRAPLWTLGVAVGLVGLVWAIRILWPAVGGPAPTQPDDARYAVFIFATGAGLESQINLAQRLTGALSRWVDLTVLDPIEAPGPNSQGESVSASIGVMADEALSLGAGRFIRASVGQVGSGFQVRAELRDSRGDGHLLSSQMVRVPPGLAGIDSLFVRLVDRLLLHDFLRSGEVPVSGTRFLAAQRAFLLGEREVEEWNLAAADSAFSAATTTDPDYAEAHLWTALTRAWLRTDRARWTGPAQQAALGTALSARDRIMADAILAQARGDFARACPLWETLAEGEPDYFGGWYGTASCLVRDEVVLPDPASPSGWRFRTSYHHALGMFQTAFELAPPILSSYREGSYAALRDLFKIGGYARRSGVAARPDTGQFTAAPAWRGDTFALVPYPDPETRLTVTAQEMETAVQRLRSRFHDVAVAWAAAAPGSADAAEALAISLTMLGDLSALDEIRRARSLVKEEVEGLRVAGVEAWMLLAFGLPTDPDRVRRARALADSALRSARLDNPPDPLLLAGLAALTGRGAQAVVLARAAVRPDREDAPMPLQEAGTALLMFAALGGPSDSLDVLEARVGAYIDESLLPDARAEARLRWLGRPATLAFPGHIMKALESLRGQRDYLLNYEASFVSGDTAAAREGLDERRRARLDFQPSSLTLDGLYPEAELLFGMGEFQAAADWLDPTFRALPSTMPGMFSDPVKAAALVRAAALRSRIAHHLGDRERADLWRRAVTTLWSDADPFLQPLVEDLRRLF